MGRCPHRCADSHDVPFDAVLGIVPYQQTSIELVRLGCLFQQLWEVAEAYGDTLPTRTPQKWFERLRHQLRHGYGHRIVQELGCLLKYPSTPASAQPTVKRVQQYLSKHLAHLQYRQFKKQGLPIGSGMGESACKWLIEQRFKGTGMRWSETGFNHLLHLRLAWVNGRFDPLFAEHPLTLHLYSPNR